LNFYTPTDFREDAVLSIPLNISPKAKFEFLNNFILHKYFNNGGKHSRKLEKASTGTTNGILINEHPNYMFTPYPTEMGANWIAPQPFAPQMPQTSP
jgi:hypothetical protein